MENEQPTLENTEVAPAAAPKTRTTRSRRATSAVTSPGTAAAAPAEAETPAKKAPVRRSRAKKSDSPLSSSAAEAEAPSVSDAGLSLLDAISGDAVSEAANSEKAGSEAAANDVAAPAKKAPRRRASAPVTAPVSGEVAGQGELILTGGAPATVVPEEDAPARKAPVRRSRAAKAPVTKVAAEQHADTGVVEVQATAEVATEKADAPKAATSRTRSTSRRASAKAADVAAPEAAQVADQESVSEVGAATEEAPVQVAAAVAPKATRSRRRSSAPTSTPASESAASAVTVTAAEADVPTVAGAAAEGTVANSEEAAQELVEAPQAIDAPEQAEPAVTDSLFHAPDSGISALFLAPDLSLVVPVATTQGGNPEENTQDGADADQRGRSRNRNRRPRAADTQPVDESQDVDVAESDSDDSDDGVTSRRRRRRRRGDTDLELTGGSDEDPPNTVTRVRAPRVPAEPTASVSNRVTSLRGSTRLEAKKQRRRDSRDSGRRRTVITEAEFLARRESVDRVMVVRQADDRIQIGVLEDGILAEHFVSKTQQDSLIGNVYVGKVQNVLPSMEAAFVDIGRGRNAVLYAGEVDWDAADLNGQPRRIENALKSGDSVLVQVSKDPVGHKGARLTSQISLPGRYLVFVPGGSMTGISRKLPDVERNRLKRVLKDHLPENAGVIVRTAAEGASEEELTNDINRLRAQWEGINNRAASSKTLAPEMLYGEPDLTIKVVRDVFNEDFSKLIVSGEDAWDTIEAYVTYVAPDLLDRLEKWTNPEDIFSAHRIDEQINKALERKVFLPSGGSLVIDRTEAMTVVDVNTGKFTGSGGNLEETVTKNNLEAAEEVVRQLRLRDIGGIIVIDFIDMVLESNRDLVLRRLVECLGRDRTKHQVAEVTSLGLIQMTRKRMGTGLLEVFGEQCGTCAGRGMVTHEIPVEHRRPHTPGVEGAQVQAQVHAPTVEQREPERTANRSTRSERKRNRNRTQGNEAEQHQETPVTPLSDEAAEALEAAKAQKAHEARAALANIAAAAAATHHEHSPAQGHHQAADASEQHVMHDAGILTLGGEAIELPRGHRSESGGMVAHNNADQAAALAGLTQALDQLSAPGAEHSAPEHSTPEPSTHEHKVAEAEESGSNRSRARRGRRNRSARSAQGGADMTVETSEAPVTSQGSAPHSSAQVRISTPAPVVHKSAEPIILGVGVPASEL
ncbi:ribonuclease E [Arthrobacter sp. UYCu511]|uniref:Rne/Rng family ribonuclease n=1 Tax=Arthrobacter sp. UYCu511 TaxID=3156337 RepID=UPI0033976702